MRARDMNMDRSSARASVRPLAGVRVLFVLPSLALGGAERQAFLLARHLMSEEGASVRLVGFGESGGVADLCDQFAIPHETFETRHRARDRVGQVIDLLRFAVVIRRCRAQILLPYCMFQNVIGALTCRLGGARLCIWNQRDEGRLRLHPWAEWLALRAVHCFVSNSTHGAEFLTASLGVPRDRVHVIRNGIQMDRAQFTRQEWRTRLGLSESAFAACMLANLHRYKDHATLLAAWRLVVDRLRPRAIEPHLLLAGAFGDQHKFVSTRVRDLGLDGNVQILGEVRDVAGLLQAADLGVFSSIAEGMPNAVLECMASGLAVVGTDYPGIREALGEDGAHWLAPPKDAEGLASRVVALAVERDLRAQVGDAGRRRVEAAFSAQRMCERMTERIAAEWAVRQNR